MASINDPITRMLPQEYTKSRDIETVRNYWNPIIDREMSRHWDLIEEGIRGFKLARYKMLSALTKFERDETAELILRDFLDSTFPGALDLITQIDPIVNQYPSRLAPEAVMVCDNDDIRSVTMDVEPGPSTRRHGESSMGPPPCPAAPLTPVTPAGLKETREQGAAEAPSVWDHPDSPSSGTAHGILSLRHTAKRSLDVMEVDPPQTPESPTKKSKGLIGPQPTGPATEPIDLWEVVAKQYIFKDNRCGPGWYVVRCNTTLEPKRFQNHPFEGDLAMDHFNDPKSVCHDTNKIYILDDIIRDFTYRVFDVDEELSEQRVKSANTRLQKENPVPPGSAKKQRKGKERAGQNRSTATKARQGTTDSDGSYHNEMIQEVIAEFLAEV
ncbi:hypothetical protein Daus18300_011029 [Diaporthe australafricana]|uniref:HNH nuclease domain-containing protein n=1 Tax=Diaporthe australafricana TaxID=127596 RepID=A0ABR3W894_9PEZI